MKAAGEKSGNKIKYFWRDAAATNARLEAWSRKKKMETEMRKRRRRGCWQTQLSGLEANEKKGRHSMKANGGEGADEETFVETTREAKY